ncbi:class I SAM-dependent methyltransferase [Helicobacter sp. MIT 05-5293]|nr:class I SAM-dependent methyltransferase [Helicobacter sp. MIT 05-5293]
MQWIIVNITTEIFVRRNLTGGGAITSCRKSGFLVNQLLPHLTSYYHLYTDGFCANHLDKIGGDIDLCIIDTVHAAPGEAMDFLMVLPYLKPNAVIILHDIAYHTFSPIPFGKHRNICALLFFALIGDKCIPPQYEPYGHLFQNIGSCTLDPNQNQYVELYFRLLHLPWTYIPSQKDLDAFISHITKHYDKTFVDAFGEILTLQKKWFDQEAAQRRPQRTPMLKRWQRSIKKRINFVRERF